MSAPEVPPGVPLGRYGCPVCERRFKSLGDKKRHIRREHKK